MWFSDSSGSDQTEEAKAVVEAFITLAGIVGSGGVSSSVMNTTILNFAVSYKLKSTYIRHGYFESSWFIHCVGLNFEFKSGGYVDVQVHIVTTDLNLVEGSFLVF